MAWHLLYVYVPNAGRNEANAMFQAITGNAADASTLSLSKTINAVLYYYCGISFNEAQYLEFRERIHAIRGAWWYEVSMGYEQTRVLTASNALEVSLGELWSAAASETDIPSASLPTTVYAAPDGSYLNTGEASSPLDLRSAMADSYLEIDVILQDGNYTMASQYNWSITNRTIRAESFLGAFVDTLAAAPNIEGDNGILAGIVFDSSDSRRTSALSDGTGLDIDFETRQINLNASNSLFLHCVFRNILTLFFGNPASNSTLYGSMSYYIGFDDASKGNGHALYSQNNTGTKLIKHNMGFISKGWNYHHYSSNGVNLIGTSFVENIAFGGGLLADPPLPRNDYLMGANHVAIEGISLIGNQSGTGGSGHLNFYLAGAVDVILEDNHMTNGVSGSYEALSESGNVWDTVGNTYALFPDEYENGVLGIYGETLARLAIYNEANANTVAVDVSAIYQNGDVVNAHNAQDWQVDIQELTVVGGSVTINMQASNRSVEAPVGASTPNKTFPTFGAFLLRKA